MAFDDPWLNYGPIITAPSGRVAEVFALTPVTPRLVAGLIQAALAAGWQVHGDGGPLRFMLTKISSCSSWRSCIPCPRAIR